MLLIIKMIASWGDTKPLSNAWEAFIASQRHFEMGARRKAELPTAVGAKKPCFLGLFLGPKPGQNCLSWRGRTLNTWGVGTFPQVQSLKVWPLFAGEFPRKLARKPAPAAPGPPGGGFGGGQKGPGSHIWRVLPIPRACITAVNRLTAEINVSISCTTPLKLHFKPVWQAIGLITSHSNLYDPI